VLFALSERPVRYAEDGESRAVTLSLTDLIISTIVPVLVIVALLVVIAYKVWQLRPFRKKRPRP
jgi:hypothetical protein